MIIKPIMDIQLQTRVPIIYSIMTAVTFHENGEHEAIFSKHFESKGEEAENAYLKTLENYKAVQKEVAARAA